MPVGDRDKRPDYQPLHALAGNLYRMVQDLPKGAGPINPNHIGAAVSLVANDITRFRTAESIILRSAILARLVVMTGGDKATYEQPIEEQIANPDPRFAEIIERYRTDLGISADTARTMLRTVMNTGFYIGTNLLAENAGAAIGGFIVRQAEKLDEEREKLPKEPAPQS